MRNPLIALLALCCSAVMTQAQGQDHYKNGQELTGTWRITATIPAGVPVCPGVSPCTYLAVATVMSDGTVIQSANIPNTSAGHGVWKRNGLRTFKMVALYFRFDAAGNPIGSAETTITTQVDPTGRLASGSFTANIYDISNAKILDYAGTVTASRMEVQ